MHPSLHLPLRLHHLNHLHRHHQLLGGPLGPGDGSGGLQQGPLMHFGVHLGVRETGAAEIPGPVPLPMLPCGVGTPTVVGVGIAPPTAPHVP